MSLLKPILGVVALSSALALAGCAPASAGAGATGGGAVSGVASPKPDGHGSSLQLIDLCSKVPAATVASMLGRPYAEVHHDIHTAAASGCDYEGAGGLKSDLILSVSIQSGASRSAVDKILANEAEDGENAIHIDGMGDYAGAVKEVVAVLYGTTVVVAIDNLHPSGTSDLTTAELRQVVKTVATAAGA